MAPYVNSSTDLFLWLVSRCFVAGFEALLPYLDSAVCFLAWWGDVDWRGFETELSLVFTTSKLRWLILLTEMRERETSAIKSLLNESFINGLWSLWRWVVQSFPHMFFRRNYFPWLTSSIWWSHIIPVMMWMLWKITSLPQSKKVIWTCQAATYNCSH